MMRWTGIVMLGVAAVAWGGCGAGGPVADFLEGPRGPRGGGPVLLAVVAHPDDETMFSGTLALAQDRGWDVRLVCATSGDAGADLSGRGLSGQALAAEREKELAEAARRLGLVEPPLLLRFPDGQLWEHRGPFEEELEKIFRRVEPQVVITFGPEGVTDHPDHITAGLVASRVFDRLGTAEFLYYAVITPAFSARLMADIGHDVFHRAVTPSLVAVRIDIGEVLDRKFHAMGAYETQFQDPIGRALEDAYRDHPQEEFIRARRVRP